MGASEMFAAMDRREEPRRQALLPSLQARILDLYRKGGKKRNHSNLKLLDRLRRYSKEDPLVYGGSIFRDDSFRAVRYLLALPASGRIPNIELREAPHANKVCGCCFVLFYW